MGIALRFLRFLPLLILSPILIGLPLVTLLVADLAYFIRRPKRNPIDTQPSTSAASVIIPNWNGRDLLEKYLPSVEQAVAGNQANEIIVVDNGSTDDSVDLLRSEFPAVRVLALPRNLGFGGGSNAGFEAAANDIVVLLNNDMRVKPDFLPPLLEAFTDEKVFAVSCQIFFGDPGKPRQETGLTEGWWENGGLRVRHHIDNSIVDLFPCFYGGGGSCAFDRHKFLELGGFDSLFAPFYLEDTDLGYLAWKRGWQVLYQPASQVVHEHRGTIGRRFSDEQIGAVLQKNFILFAWKNIHEWRRLLSHFGFTWAGSAVSALFGPSPERAAFTGLWRAFGRLFHAVRSRWRARELAMVGDTEAFRRPLGGYFRDRFAQIPGSPDRLRVLFVSPYPICPPTHGGAVFMHQTCHELVKHCELHLVVTLDRPGQQAAHAELAARCASAEFVVRQPGVQKYISTLTPHAVREFDRAELRWLIHRKLYVDAIDVLQLEYLTMGQYGGRYRRIASILFEHDIYFQSVSRALRRINGLRAAVKPAYEYMRALRYELRLLPQFDRVQVCSRENASYLTGFLPQIRDRLDSGYRAGIDISSYNYLAEGREPRTMLFIGSFQHRPNVAALEWLLREVLPLVLAKEPRARLAVVGSGPPVRQSYAQLGNAVEFRGFVEDVREPLGRYAVFACPILSGSGVRVKLLEAFASGIPSVSTRLGAEGLASRDGELCLLADDPAEFAERTLELFANPEAAREMATRARMEVEKNFDLAEITDSLVASYRRTVERKRTLERVG